MKDPGRGPPPGRSGPLDLKRSLLGLRIRIRGPASDAADYLNLRYGNLPERSGRGPTIEASFAFQEDHWVVSVTGRPVRPVVDLEAVVDTLDAELQQALVERRPDLQYVHAGVVSWQDRAVAIPGVGRSFKGALVLALLQAGARYLSDDLLVYDPKEDQVAAFPRAIALGEQETSFFPDLTPFFLCMGSHRLLPLKAVGSDILQDSAPLGVVVRNNWDPVVEDILEPLPRAAAMDSLAGARLDTGASGTGEPFLEDPARTAQGWCLRWRDPHSASALLLEALGR